MFDGAVLSGCGPLPSFTLTLSSVAMMDDICHHWIFEGNDKCRNFCSLHEVTLHRHCHINLSHKLLSCYGCRGKISVA